MSPVVPPAQASALQFGPYLVYPQARLILEGGRPLRLGRRALDVLLVLLEHAGEVVGKQQLMARVWPGQALDEGNLRVHMAALRKALGDDQDGRRYIATVAMRGYSFVAPLSRVAAAAPLPLAAEHNLPPRRNRLQGREQAVAEVLAQLRRTRAVTLVGCGGIGKTSVALQVAEQALGRYRDGVRLLDLAALQDARPLGSTLAALLGLAGQAGASLESLCRQVGDRQMLLLIDNCEHLAEACAHLLEALLAAAPQVHVLLTSRERLRAAGESVYALAPLACPPEEVEELSAALAYPAFALLLERLRNVDEGFAPSGAELPLLLRLCRRLDGLPLAIELAASQLARRGAGAARLLDGAGCLDCQNALPRPRHQDLRATLDWSYASLPAAEQACLRRLALFCAGFSLDCAAALLGHAEEQGAAGMLLSQLAAKSLLAVEAGDDGLAYRLLEPTRLYALEKLTATGELHAARAAHLALCLARLQRAQEDWPQLPTRQWLQCHARWLPDLRAALNWGLDSAVRHPLAIRLAACSAPLWQELSLLHEYGCYVARALQLLGARLADEEPASLQLAIQLELALGNCSYHAQAPVAPAAEAFQSAMYLARRTGDSLAELQALSGQVAVDLCAGRYQQALELSERFAQLSQGQGEELELSALRLQVLALHFSGDQLQALPLAETVLQRLLAQAQRPNRFAACMGVQYDQRVASLTILARILWLRGQPQQAEARVRQALELACALQHPPSILYCLATAGCVIAHYNGDTALAHARLQLMFDVSLRHAVPLFTGWAQHYAGALRYEGLPPPEAPAPGLVRDIVMTLAAQWPSAGAAPLIRASTGAVGWCAAEQLRNEACQLLQGGGQEACAAAEGLLLRALTLARRQGALAWELRSATTLAELWGEQGREARALELLEPLCGPSGDAAEGPDLRTARACLARLARGAA